MTVTEVCIRPHPGITGVHCVFRKSLAKSPANEAGENEARESASWQSSLPRPFVALIGGMHGNEPCGLIAVEELVAMANEKSLPVQSGTLFLIHANPAASAEGKRHTENGTDLNRLFSYAFAENLPKEQWTPEHHRAAELRPLLLELDVALDLHSASAPTPPFGIVSSVFESRGLSRQLGLPYLTHGWEGPGLPGELVLLGVLTARDKPSFAVECGQHEDPKATQRARETAARFLVATHTLPTEAGPPPAEHSALELRVVDAVKKPSPEFAFQEELLGFQRIDAGAIVGGDANVEMRCKRPSYAIMPNASVDVGHDMLYLAHKIDPASLRTTE